MTGFPSPEYDDAVAAACDGTATDAQLKELHEMLRTNPAARDAYLWQVELHARLATTPTSHERARVTLSDLPGKAQGRPRRGLWAALVATAAALALAAWAGIANWRTPDRLTPPVTAIEPNDVELQYAPQNGLAAEWRIAPTGTAVYQVLAPDRIKLERGELRIVSSSEQGAKPPQLTVETPSGTALAAGTDFLVSTYQADTASLVRVLVMAGAVTLRNTLGAISGDAGTLLTADASSPPVKLVVDANSNFGLGLFNQLAKKSPGENLFYSPYSVSLALAMATEGARGATAEELGRVLQLPDVARRIGVDAQTLPWNTLLVRTGFAELNARIRQQAREQAPLVEKIKELRAELATVQNQVDALGQQKGGNRDQLRDLSARGEELANELNQLFTQVDRYELRVANGLWVDRTFPIQPDFVKLLRSHYGVGFADEVDFRGKPDASRDLINAWCEKQTEGLIPAPLPAGSIIADTRIVLANAIYFLGQWAEPFEVQRTADADFTLAGGEKVQVPMMFQPYFEAGRYAAFGGDGAFFETPAEYDPQNRDESKLYPDERGFAIVELPYKGGDLAMDLIVPRSADGLPAIEALLTAEHLASWLPRLQGRTIELRVPRFKLRSSFDLREPLIALGLNDAFDPDRADFTGITSAEHFWLGSVIHEAVVEVNEKGTEAAAFSGLLFPTESAVNPQLVPFVPTVTADHPFLILIRDTRSGTILFLGRVANPAAA